MGSQHWCTTRARARDGRGIERPAASAFAHFHICFAIFFAFCFPAPCFWKKHVCFSHVLQPHSFSRAGVNAHPVVDPLAFHSLRVDLDPFFPPPESFTSSQRRASRTKDDVRHNTLILSHPPPLPSLRYPRGTHAQKPTFSPSLAYNTGHTLLMNYEIDCLVLPVWSLGPSGPCIAACNACAGVFWFSLTLLCFLPV